MRIVLSGLAGFGIAAGGFIFWILVFRFVPGLERISNAFWDRVFRFVSRSHSE